MAPKTQDWLKSPEIVFTEPLLTESTPTSEPNEDTALQFQCLSQPLQQALQDAAYSHLFELQKNHAAQSIRFTILKFLTV